MTQDSIQIFDLKILLKPTHKSSSHNQNVIKLIVLELSSFEILWECYDIRVTDIPAVNYFSQKFPSGILIWCIVWIWHIVFLKKRKLLALNLFEW